MSTHLVKTTFQERDQPQNLIFHSDRGSQYVSKTLTGLFQQHSVKQSFSATARPLDNAVAETFFSSFKHEEKLIERTTQSKSIFTEAWRNIFASTMRCEPTRRCTTRHHRHLMMLASLFYRKAGLIHSNESLRFRIELF